MNQSNARAFISRMLWAAGVAAACHAGVTAADVTAISVRKGQVFFQESTSAPEPNFSPYVFSAKVAGNLSSIFEAEGRTPFGTPLFLFDHGSGLALEARTYAETVTELDGQFGTGTYTFTVDSEDDGFSVIQLSLPDTSFPTPIPQIANYNDAQSIDASSDFTLNWNAFTGAAGNDHYELEILHPDGFAAFIDSGGGTSATIPGGTLESDTFYTARLRFVKETSRDTSSYPGAAGTTGFFNETEFYLATGDGGGGNGGDDTTAPMLLVANPPDGSTDVEVNTFVTFVFSEAMVPSQSIEWSGNVNSANFTYSWLPGGSALLCSYAGGFPGDAVIAWTLNPVAGAASNFRDPAGNELPTVQGSFSTGEGGDPTDPCDGGGGVDNGLGFISLYKLVNYVQTGDSTPVPDTDFAAILSGNYRGPTNQTTSAVTITGPGGVDESMTDFFGMFFLNEEFESQAALEAAWPAGEYTVTTTGSAGTQEAMVTLGQSGAVTIPRVLNLPAFNTMNVEEAFTLNFQGFAGAGVNDSISIDISDDSGSVFFAPDICEGIELANTATSIVIPANTFQSGRNYEGSIRFNRLTELDTNSIPNLAATAGVAAATSFSFTVNGGGTTDPTPPTWLTPVRNPDGTIDFPIESDAGAVLVIEGTTDFETWEIVATEVAVDGSVNLTITPGTIPHRFFRAIIQ